MLSCGAGRVVTPSFSLGPTMFSGMGDVIEIFLKFRNAKLRTAAKLRHYYKEIFRKISSAA